MFKKLIYILFLGAFAFLGSCDYKKDATETNTYNSYFIYPKPDDKAVYVGTVTGLSSCKYIVSDYYSKRRKFFKGEGGWDYKCCLKTPDSNCAEKHRYKEG